MALILSLDTADVFCSVALHKDRLLLASSHLSIPHSSSSKLILMVDELLQRCDILRADLCAIAVSAGPGSYTGLRVGVTTAKGFCYSLGIPLVAVNTLEILARQAPIDLLSHDTLICPVIDAGRINVFSMLMDTGGNVLLPPRVKALNENSFADRLNKHKILFLGSGVKKCTTVISHANTIFLSGINPSAVQLGELAFDRFSQKQFEDPFRFEPYYLRAFNPKVSMPTKKPPSAHLMF